MPKRSYECVNLGYVPTAPSWVPQARKRPKREWTWFDYAKCFMMHSPEDTDRLEKLLKYLNAYYITPGAWGRSSGFHWIVKYALFLFHRRGDLKMFVECVACVSLSMKMWDDLCPEESDGLYQHGMTKDEKAALGTTEARVFLNEFGGRILHHSDEIVKHWKLCARVTRGPIIVDV